MMKILCHIILPCLAMYTRRMVSFFFTSSEIYRNNLHFKFHTKQQRQKKKKIPMVERGQKGIAWQSVLVGASLLLLAGPTLRCGCQASSSLPLSMPVPERYRTLNDSAVSSSNPYPRLARQPLDLRRRDRLAFVRPRKVGSTTIDDFLHKTLRYCANYCEPNIGACTSCVYTRNCTFRWVQSVVRCVGGWVSGGAH